MELHPLNVPGIPGPLPDTAALVARAEWERWRRGPQTVPEVLAGISERMDAEDELARYQADPITYIRAERRRRSLWGRLFGR